MFKENKMTTFPTEFTKEIKEQILTTLTAFDVVMVTRENGKYTSSTGAILTNDVKPTDFKVWSFNKSEIFTEDEMILNYVNSFKCFPIEYPLNKRDYKELLKLNDTTKAILVDGYIKIVDVN
jgi:hypothetical protein